ncbi:hypothetical protein [Actinacidiphila soli]|uniref:hypothetical protein n=1 Tax=Actinacidiphila soli TaxID=2487275 RepID=UPI000FCBBE90|nr:hypothetical protein [Actinacidiphila soli]
MSTQTAPTQATAPTRRRRTTRSSWGAPIELGVVFGGYAAWISNSNGGSTTRTALIAVVGTVALAIVCYVVGRVGPAVARELRAALHGAVFGCAMGYLLSLSGYSLLRASLVGLALGASVTAASFYWFYEHEA